MENSFKEVIVVEGNHDKARIKSIFPKADVQITNGAEVSVETLVVLKALNHRRGLILMLDPDVPGEKIRRLIADYVGPVKHVFLPKHECTDIVKRKVGIEHASLSVIRDALSKHIRLESPGQTVERSDLLSRGLIGKTDAAIKRRTIAKRLNIGLCNGKAFHRKLNMFGITIEEIDRVMS